MRLPFMPPQVSRRQVDWPGVFSLMDSPLDDTELHRWLRWASDWGHTPLFVSKVAEAACAACTPNYELLRPVLLELKRRYPEG